MKIFRGHCLNCNKAVVHEILSCPFCKSDNVIWKKEFYITEDKNVDY